MKFYSHWLFLSVLCVLFWGLWGFLSKITADKLNWTTMLGLFCISMAVILMIISPGSFIIKFSKYHLIGLLAGLMGTIGFCFFYISLRKGPASSVIPVTSLYIVIVVILAFIFLKEPLSLKKLLGIISAVLAIYLLSG